MEAELIERGPGTNDPCVSWPQIHKPCWTLASLFSCHLKTSFVPRALEIS
jgi:hypothetical protein